jgi:hypothetical protein
MSAKYPRAFRNSKKADDVPPAREPDVEEDVSSSSSDTSSVEELPTTTATHVSRNKPDDVDSNASQMSQKDCKQIEQHIGFKPYGSNNYYCTVYYKDSEQRDILFEGGVPLHEFPNYIMDFFRHYVMLGTPTKLYFMTVLITEKPYYYNILKIEGKATKKERLTEIQPILQSCVKTFDGLYQAFIRDGNKKYHKYREDTKLQVLIDSFQEYQRVKKSLSEFIVPPK